MSQEKLASLKSERDQVVAEFEKARVAVDARLQEKFEEVGIIGFVRNIQGELEQVRVKAQSRVDFLTGQISMLEDVLGEAKTNFNEEAQA
jgi:ribosome-binding protein aMBF1 (putative translation factor)